VQSGFIGFGIMGASMAVNPAAGDLLLTSKRTLPSLDRRANPRVPARRFALVDTSVRR
jgi:3-hydroxyisobutyrate dehydrogenase-like beta-hydroxyacid dehydrogenase